MHTLPVGWQIRASVFQVVGLVTGRIGEGDIVSAVVAGERNHCV
jgi:hypothetical protein